MTKAKDEFLELLETSIRDILSDKKTTTEQKLKAIDIGLGLRKKSAIEDPDKGTGSFFRK